MDQNRRIEMPRHPHPRGQAAHLRLQAHLDQYGQHHTIRYDESIT